jgi:hypothetical protein
MIIDGETQVDIEVIFGRDHFTRNFMKSFLKSLLSRLKDSIFDPRPENDESHSSTRYKE